MRLITSLFIALFLTQTESPQLTVTRPDWSGPQRQSLHLPPDSFALDFALQPAASPKGPTVALFATGRFPGRIGEIYGGRIDGATQVVAVDSQTGEAFAHPAESGDVVPISAAMDPRPHRKIPGVAVLDATQVWFNVDLRSLLILPEAAGKYEVFLWLDEMTSPLKTAEIAGVSPFPRNKPPIQAPLSVIISKSKWTPKSNGSVVLSAGSKAGERFRVYGSVGSPRSAPQPPILTVLALDYLSRKLAWRSMLLSESELRKSGGAFQFDAASVLDPPKNAESKMFVVAVWRSELSNVIVIAADTTQR